MPKSKRDKKGKVKVFFSHCQILDFSSLKDGSGSELGEHRLINVTEVSSA